MLAKQGKPFTDRELIKLCLREGAEETCPEKTNLFKSISLSARTISQNVEVNGKNISGQLENKANDFVCFFLALDVSTEATVLFMKSVPPMK